MQPTRAVTFDLLRNGRAVFINDTTHDIVTQPKDREEKGPSLHLSIGREAVLEINHRAEVLRLDKYGSTEMKSLVDRPTKTLVSTSGGLRLRRFCRVAILTASVTAAPAAAFATTHISGTAQAVNVDAENSSLREVLSALGKQFNLKIRSCANLDRKVGGIYRGSLVGVVSLLLEGYDFIVKTNRNGIEVAVLGGPSGSAVSDTQPQSVPNAVASPVVKSPNGHKAGVSDTTAAAHIPMPPQIADQSQTMTEKRASSSNPSTDPLVFKVAESPAPPVINQSTPNGPVLEPPTNNMPVPKISGKGPSPIPTTNAPAMPMPNASANPAVKGTSSVPTPQKP